MLSRIIVKAFLCLLIGTASVALFGCGKPAKQPVKEAPPQPQETRALRQPPPQKTPELRRPELAEVQDAVKRVFRGAAIIDSKPDPGFITGDFNGDLSQDIVIVLKPVKLAEMNRELPSWMLKDPFIPPGHPGQPPLRVGQDEELLAVIHGHGPSGWRDPQATQTYLLKNAVGNRLSAQPKKEFLDANKAKKVPYLRGDLIGQEIRGASGFLYYTGATYAWYNPKTSK